MRIVGSNRYCLSRNEKRTLALMAKNGSVIEDIEEGEISDETQSVEEISAEDFKQEAKVSKPKGDSRVWMGDLLKYRVSSNYGPGLYNLAWAQAVQNKPLDEILMRDFRSNENSKRSSSNPLVNSREEDNNNNKSLSTAKEVCNIIIDDSSEEVDSKVQDAGQGEKEEGELEEGEIEVDSEMMGEPMEGVCGDNSPTGDSERKDDEFEKKIQSVREVLQSVTAKEAEKSFYGVCSQLCECLDSIEKMVSENCGSGSAIDALSIQALAGIRAVNTVFLSMNPKQQEQNKEAFSRLLVHSKSKNPALFLPEQLQEIEAAILSLDAKFTLLSGKGLDKEEAQNNNRTTSNEFGISEGKPGQVFDSSNKFISEPASVKWMDQNNANRGSGTLKQGLLSGFRNRGAFGPLLDLHRDHDADSLPSPTREAPPTFTLPKSQVTGVNVVKSGLATPKATDNIEDGIVHPYVTDALKAVSTYQQKFGHTSFFMNTRLPSPTPSEECEIGDGDCNGEVSSSSTAGSSSSVNLAAPSQPFGSFTSQVNGASLQALTKTVGQLGSGLNPNFKAQAKSRDPRLRFANSEAGAFDLNQHPPVAGALKTESFGGQISSRKNKIVDESVLDGHALKRQRNGLTSSTVSRDVQMVSGSGGWLEDSSSARSLATNKRQLEENLGTDIRQSENGQNVSGQRKDTAVANLNVRNGGNEQLQLTGSSSTVSLPSLLKDIAVNPTMLMQLIVEQQKLAEAQKKSSSLVQNTSAFGSSVITGPVPVANASSSSSSDNEQMSMAKPQSHTQVLSMVEGGKIRMKPRDPRRVLHGGILQKNESLGPGPEQFKVNGAPSSITQMGKDNVVVRQQGEQAQTTSMPPQSGPLPDIARQFTKKLKNLADIVTSQATNTASTVPLSGLSLSMAFKMENSNIGVTDTKEQQSGCSSKAEEGIAGTCRPQNTWGDFEHLFEGYDDQQKAAIQQERARRIEEQNKMFAARKLCLVLDLDHTLLNSAKFNEVDPVHEEILRKKEEQDREKPHRHLFRLQHMGMWTKLRPGVWNFLEKASKLFELHLYTMGNKLYATEMAKLLDPTGALFAGRVISKGDDGDPCDGDERVPKSKDLDGVLGMESAVVIIDDSVRVWPHNKLNLIVVERYTYFPCSRRQFGLLGPSLLEIDHDERPEDGTLASSLAVTERIHQNFFSHWSLHDVDVRNILASEQRKILAGCRIVFSRVFPVGEANPHLHPLWQTAEQFGAVCTTQIDEQVTHVVANSRGTDKVNWALSTGRFVVQPGWVEASALLYRRANEHDFAV